jgi:hypothetical protein
MFNFLNPYEMGKINRTTMKFRLQTKPCPNCGKYYSMASDNSGNEGLKIMKCILVTILDNPDHADPPERLKYFTFPVFL